MRIANREVYGSRFARNPPGALDWTFVIPVLIVLVASTIAFLLVVQEKHDIAEFRKSVDTENRLRLASSVSHIEDYFDSVYSTVLFISLDEAIQAMNRRSEAYAQKLYDHQWEHHRLTEIYVVEREFDGSRAPIMTFERGSIDMSREELHSLAREREEYLTLIGHLQRFHTEPSLHAQLSGEIRLCAPDAQGGQSLGFVYSVPIRAGDRLVGLVAGMMESSTLANVLGQGLHDQFAMLITEKGQVVSNKRVNRQIQAWIREHIHPGRIDELFARVGGTFTIGDYQARVARPNIVADQKAWIVYLHPNADYDTQATIGGMPGHFVLAASLLGSGFALAFLIRSSGLRVHERLDHLEERQQLERAVQDAREREQRRIGEALHEDLCQRLTGIEAMAKLLEKRLTLAEMEEAHVAGEVTREIKESLASARELADELQPVSLLEHGFVAALEEHAARARQRKGVKCTVEDHGFPDDLDEATSMHLFRIAQEALDNSLRHSYATTITIILDADEKHLSLRINDDGLGFSMKALDGTGTGIRIMQYRADLLGGHFEIKPAQPRGTMVLARVPRPPSRQSRIKTETM